MSPSTLSTLRDFVPIRPLRRAEAMRIAELQAQRFLALSGITGPSVPERIISELPRIQVERMNPFPVSGASHWSEGRWLVVLRASEPLTRQRFSLAHELKHIIDHRFVDIIYEAIPAEQRHRAIERICDYFAGCLLMPRPWLKRAWCEGVQDLPSLASRFGASVAAIQVRLNQIGLMQPPARCDNAGTDWYLRSLKPRIDRITYTKPPSPAFT